MERQPTENRLAPRSLGVGVDAVDGDGDRDDQGRVLPGRDIDPGGVPEPERLPGDAAITLAVQAKDFEVLAGEVSCRFQLAAIGEADLVTGPEERERRADR